jgi:hypothetical protein
MFRRLIEMPGAPVVQKVVNEFAADARVYDGFDTQPAGSREREFFDRLAVLDVSTIYPLLIFIFRQPAEKLSVERRRKVVTILESWLVRRMLIRLTPKNYNRYFLELLRSVQKDVEHADEVLGGELRGATADTNIWPSDQALLVSLTQNTLYYRVAGHRIVMVLAAIESALRERERKSERVSLPSGLTIEHILPQKWQTHWPVGGDPQAVFDRENHVNRLGNLTLTTSSLNPGMSHASWSQKMPALRRHSLLLLNARLCEKYDDKWDEKTIDNRGADLAAEIVRIWPGPNATSWDGG